MAVNITPRPRTAAAAYSYAQTPNYRDLLGIRDQQEAQSGVEIDVQSMLEEGRSERHAEEMNVARENISEQQREYNLDVGLRERQVGLQEAEWQKRSAQYDIELEQGKLEMEMNRQLMSRLDSIISSGNWSMV